MTIEISAPAPFPTAAGWSFGLFTKVRFKTLGCFIQAPARFSFWRTTPGLGSAKVDTRAVWDLPLADASFTWA